MTARRGHPTMAVSDDTTMTEVPMSYDPRQFTDALFPKGRPECSNHDGRPVYLAGLCGDCYASTGWAKEHRDTDGQHHGLTGPGSSASTRCPLCPPRSTDA